MNAKPLKRYLLKGFNRSRPHSPGEMNLRIGHPSLTRLLNLSYRDRPHSIQLHESDNVQEGRGLGSDPFLTYTEVEDMCQIPFPLLK